MVRAGDNESAAKVYEDVTENTQIGQIGMTLRPIGGDAEDEIAYICFVKLDGLSDAEIEQKMGLVYMKLLGNPTITALDPTYRVESVMTEKEREIKEQRRGH